MTDAALDFINSSIELLYPTQASLPARTDIAPLAASSEETKSLTDEGCPEPRFVLSGDGNHGKVVFQNLEMDPSFRAGDLNCSLPDLARSCSTASSPSAPEFVRIVSGEVSDWQDEQKYRLKTIISDRRGENRALGGKNKSITIHGPMQSILAPKEKDDFGKTFDSSWEDSFAWDPFEQSKQETIKADWRAHRGTELGSMFANIKGSLDEKPMRRSSLSGNRKSITDEDKERTEWHSSYRQSTPDEDKEIPFLLKTVDASLRRSAGSTGTDVSKERARRRGRRRGRMENSEPGSRSRSASCSRRMVTTSPTAPEMTRSGSNRYLTNSRGMDTGSNRSHGKDEASGRKGRDRSVTRISSTGIDTSSRSLELGKELGKDEGFGRRARERSSSLELGKELAKELGKDEGRGRRARVRSSSLELGKELEKELGKDEGSSRRARDRSVKRLSSRGMDESRRSNGKEEGSSRRARARSTNRDIAGLDSSGHRLLSHSMHESGNAKEKSSDRSGSRNGLNRRSSQNSDSPRSESYRGLYQSFPKVEEEGSDPNLHRNGKDEELESGSSRRGSNRNLGTSAESMTRQRSNRSLRSPASGQTKTTANSRRVKKSLQVKESETQEASSDPRLQRSASDPKLQMERGASNKNLNKSLRREVAATLLSGNALKIEDVKQVQKQLACRRLSDTLKETWGGSNEVEEIPKHSRRCSLIQEEEKVQQSRRRRSRSRKGSSKDKSSRSNSKAPTLKPRRHSTTSLLSSLIDEKVVEHMNMEDPLHDSRRSSLLDDSLSSISGGSLDSSLGDVSMSMD